MRRIHHSLILLIVVMACTCRTAFSQPGDEPSRRAYNVAAKLSVDKEKYTVGDVINLTIETTSPEGFTVDEPVAREFLKDFELLNKKGRVDWKKEGEQKSIFQYELTAFSTGPRKLGPVTITYKPIGGEKETTRTGTAAITIESVLPADTKNLQIKEIKPPMDVKYPVYYYVIGALTAITIIALLYILTIAVIQKIRKKKLGAAEIHKTPEEIAEERLRALLNSSLLQEKKIKQFYIELSDILRQYIESRYAIMALDRTTTELYHELKSSSIPTQVAGKIRKLLACCDLVKFAREIPQDEVIHKDYDETKEIIAELKPTQTQVEQASAKG